MLVSAKAGLERLYTAKNNLEFSIKSAKTQDMTDAEKASLAEYDVFRTKFCEKMDDDLNTADAISVLFDFARKINGEQAVSVQFGQALLDRFTELCGVFEYSDKRYARPNSRRCAGACG